MNHKIIQWHEKPDVSEDVSTRRLLNFAGLLFVETYVLDLLFFLDPLFQYD